MPLLKDSRRSRPEINSPVEMLEQRLLLSTSATAAVTFSSPITVPIPGAAAKSVLTSPVVADFTGSGNSDFAILDPAAHALFVMINKGNGTFTESQALPTGNDPGSLQAVALTNGDLDLAFVNSGDGTVEIYNGSGTSTFNTTPVLITFAGAVTSGTAPTDTLQVVDVNGDGLPDLLVGTNGGIITLLASGNEGYIQQATVTGKLAGVGQFINAATASQTVGVLNNGLVQIDQSSGGAVFLDTATQSIPSTLADATTYTSNGQAIVADFNNDGNLDVATLITSSSTHTQYISVLLGKGDGTFETPTFTQIPYGATTLALGSFTTSGDEDLLVEYSTYTDVFTGNGSGQFSDTKLQLPVTGWSSVAISDFNNDGTVDILAGNQLLLNTSGLTPTTTTLTVTANPISPGQSVSLRAAVASTGGKSVPTGTVEFVDETDSSSPKVLATATLVNGAIRSPVVIGSVLGNHDIVAEYSGDSTFAASTSAVLVEQVLKNAGIPIGPTILSPNITHVKFPASVPATAKLTGDSVTLTLTNSTGTDQQGSVTLNVYAAPSTIFDASTATLIATVKKSVTLKISKMTTVSIPITEIPANLIGTTQYLIVQSADSAGSATGSSSQSFTVAAPVIALSDTLAASTLPSGITNGQKLHSSVKLKITNNGNITDDGVSIQLLANPSTGGSETDLLDLKKAAKLAPGKSETISIPIKSLPALTDGTYTLAANVTDASGNVTHANGGVFTITG